MNKKKYNYNEKVRKIYSVLSKQYGLSATRVSLKISRQRLYSYMHDIVSPKKEVQKRIDEIFKQIFERQDRGKV